MKTSQILIAFIFFSVNLLGQTAEGKAVKECFEKYKAAIMNDKGEDAANWVDQNTINYYSSVLAKVRNADSATVDQLSLLDKLMVFSIRHRARVEEIKTMDGKGLIVYAIKNGMVGKNSVARNSIGDITINGKKAKGQVLVNDEKTPLYFEFNKEYEVWKMDLTSIFPVSEKAFRGMIDESGETENEFLFRVLKMLTNRDVTGDIWKPVGK
ncbi:hypothetical protein [Pollutibacter soli]|uniref:hypothetical protein n=1 Tax=Pollutibacter soli TaxID=3034157 RepID=UPI003013A725